MPRHYVRRHFTRLALSLAVAVALSVTLAVSPSSGANEPIQLSKESMVPALPDRAPGYLKQASGNATWYFTKGRLQITKDGATTSSSVKVWAAADGRYRVKTESLDRPGRFVEVAYDGWGHQLVKIKSHADIDAAYYVIEHDKHFAITEAPHTVTRRYDSRAIQGVLLAGTSVEVGNNSMSYAADTVTRQQGDASALTIEVPSRAFVGGGKQLKAKGEEPDLAWQATKASGARIATLHDFSYRPCIRITNFRNTSTQYFSATTKTISDPTTNPFACYFVQMHIWAAGATMHEDCWAGYVGKTSQLIDYVWWSGHVDVAQYLGDFPNARACSSHTAWNEYWEPQVSDFNLLAAVVG